MNNTAYRHIRENSISLADVHPENVGPESGGMVIFAGLVRNHNEGKKVHAIEYEAHVSLADKIIGDILMDARSRWKLDNAECLHRTGHLPVGEVAVVVITTSAHRQEAYAANRHIIDRVKHEAPIWKKEIFEDGTVEWSQGCAH